MHLPHFCRTFYYFAFLLFKTSPNISAATSSIFSSAWAFISIVVLVSAWPRRFDTVIFCKSRRSAERALEKIIPYIEGKLYLKVNRAKTTVSHVSKIKYLGVCILQEKRRMQILGTPQISNKDEEQAKRTDEKKQGVGK